LVMMSAYFALAFASSLQIGSRHGWRFAAVLPLTFFLFHATYGFASLVALAVSYLSTSLRSRAAPTTRPEASNVDFGSASRRELERLRRTYARYDNLRWSTALPGNELMFEEVVRATVSMLGGMPAGFSALDVGCGDGYRLMRIGEALGVQPQHLTGVDVLPSIQSAREQYPEARFECCNAERLPFSDESFHLVLLFTVFSSIHDAEMRIGIAREAARVVSRDGAIVIYDMRYPNPANAAVRPVPARKLRSMFPGFRFQTRSITLLPPLARSLDSRSISLYPWLAAVPPLRSHTLSVLRQRTVSESFRLSELDQGIARMQDPRGSTDAPEKNCSEHDQPSRDPKYHP
jgi:SAM-dependent methyltransferase